MNARRGRSGLAMAALWLCAGAAWGDEGYYDMARVVAVEPVVVTRTVPEPNCLPDAPRAARHDRSRASLGDVRAVDPPGNLGAVMRDAVAGPPALSCLPVSERKIVGYDVTLRYGAEQWVTRMARDPGDRVRVRVTLGPPATADARAGR